MNKVHHTNLAKPLQRFWPAVLCLGLLSAALSGVPVAADDGGKGLTIAKERVARDEGWKDSESKTTMVLRNAQGEENKREIRSISLEVANDGDKGLTIFDEPKDVRGTAFLNHSHTGKPDDQWLYLPSVKRVKRIASRNKSGPFMASEFAYEDLSSFELAKFKFTWLRDDTLDGEAVFVVEQVPVDEFSGYSKSVVWLDQAEYRARKIEFYDRKNALLKTLVMSDYKQYLNKYWRPLKLQMTNHQTGKSTDLLVRDIEFGKGRTDADFDTNALQRSR
ncbi:outer membrane lipoprotein-sorting protein [Rheinheimera sp.]|uniref:outer membrane lipoprotein-sorting protein n=1 Tax=Rheinheimera sp. TaxID=1869214 RepID=UPI003D2BB1DB